MSEDIDIPNRGRFCYYDGRAAIDPGMFSNRRTSMGKHPAFGLKNVIYRREL